MWTRSQVNYVDTFSGADIRVFWQEVKRKNEILKFFVDASTLGNWTDLFFLVVTSCNASHLLLAASLAKFFFRLFFSTSCIATDLHRARCRQRNDIAQHLWELNRHQLFFKKWNSPKKSSTVVEVSLTLRLVVAVCCYRDHIKNSHVAANKITCYESEEFRVVFTFCLLSFNTAAFVFPFTPSVWFGCGRGSVGGAPVISATST